MQVKNIKIKIDEQVLSPALTISFDLEFGRKVEVPISITGNLVAQNGKVIAFLNEHQIYNDNSLGIGILTHEQKVANSKLNEIHYYSTQLTACLSPIAIDFIEELREKDREKAVRFSLQIIVKYLLIPAEPHNFLESDFLRLQIMRFNPSYNINQSDWVRHFSPQLGIGNFLLLELQIPDDKNVSEFWKELYGKMAHNLKDVEVCLRSGDWQKAMFIARKFYENAKIGDNKRGHAKFKEEFNKLMAKDQHSQQGIDDLHTAIWKLFDFLSKYAHDLDKEGNNYDIVAIASKEDAYFAYAIALGLLNLIGSKTKAD